MEDINKVLGLGESTSNFPDKKERKVYAITMMKFQPFMKSFTGVNPERLWANFIYDESSQALKDVLTMSFKDEEDIDALFEQITAQNFKEIMTMIKTVNGFEDIGTEDPNLMEV